MTKKLTSAILFLLAILSVCEVAEAQDKQTRPRTIITTDGEVDDQDSFIRLLLYSNEFDILGLVYSSSQWHYRGDGKGTKFTSEMELTRKLYGERTELRWPGTTWMQQMIGAYANVYPNLLKHSKSYPSPSYLQKLIKVGNIEFEGEMSKDTEGSEFIKQILLDKSTEPVYLQIWGGTNTVARALKSIEDQFKGKPDWLKIKERVSKKAIIYAVLDQDATYKRYIEPNWPGIRIFYNSAQFWCLAYPWPTRVPKELQSYLRGAWFGENLVRNHGPLMAMYYTWGDGRTIENDFDHTHGDTLQMRKYNMTKYDFISEGDSPAFLQLVDVGLGNRQDPAFGGWGGRMVQSPTTPNRWEDGEGVADLNPFTGAMDTAFPQTRWLDVIQNDFAARADWCIKDYSKANHAPVARLGHGSRLKGKSGQAIKLSATAIDPDKNVCSFKWWQYEEVDTYAGKISIIGSDKAQASFVIPADARPGQSIHIILEVTDNGTPQLTRYQRVVVTVN